MKTSTLMTAALLSASCFAAPNHTAPEVPSARASAIPAAALQPDLRDVPVAPAAPDVPAAANPAVAHWRYLPSPLPKSRRLDRALREDFRQQT